MMNFESAGLFNHQQPLRRRQQYSFDFTSAWHTGFHQRHHGNHPQGEAEERRREKQSSGLLVLVMQLFPFILLILLSIVSSLFSGIS